MYSANHRKKTWLHIEPGRNQDLHFGVHRKVSVRGRIVEADTGKPLPNMSVLGELAHGTPVGWADRPRTVGALPDGAKLTHRGDTRSTLPRERPALVSGNEFVAEQDYYEVSVAADGSTVIPDIKSARCKRLSVSCGIRTALPPCPPSFDSAGSTEAGSNPY